MTDILDCKPMPQENQLSASDSAYKRICWHSRRGMLELDLVLLPFVETQFLKLPQVEQHLYQRLLACEDQELFTWFMQRSAPADPQLKGMVDAILKYAKTSA